jgi:hypothetical protein
MPNGGSAIRRAGSGRQARRAQPPNTAGHPVRLSTGSCVPYDGASRPGPEMTSATTITLALGMSVDAFAAAIGKGTALDHPRVSEALHTRLVFGAVEAVTPAFS